MPVIMSGPTVTVPSAWHSTPGMVFEEIAVGLLAEREHDRIGFERVRICPVGCGRPCGIELHHLDGEIGLDRSSLMLVSHRILTPSAKASSASKVMRRHVRAVATIDDQRVFGAEPLGGACGVHRRIAAAVNDDPTAEPRRLAAVDLAQKR